MNKPEKAFLTASCVTWSEYIEYLRLTSYATVSQIYSQVCESNSIFGYLRQVPVGGVILGTEKDLRRKAIGKDYPMCGSANIRYR